MRIVIIYLLIALASCKLQEHKTAEDAGTSTSVNDPHSFAKPELAVLKHLDLDINVDFDKQQIAGTAFWTIDNISKGNEIILDAGNLNIQSIHIDADSTEAKWHLDSARPILGKALHISIQPQTTKIEIRYNTTDGASALQWLDPAQTAGKKFPFLFTQSQSIHARSWIPCQDGPAVRFTYDAIVRVPKDLLAVMSAENPRQKNPEAVYHFRQTHAIPSYLMALAVGDIAFKPIDSRTGVYAEPPMLEKVAWEFADMGKMVDAAEKLYGPYKWGRYDVLVLPPSFPYGGMENPNLTFATPTVIAGDRSLVSLVAHELAHSWSGNLVTNATWNDMWLNEGFTTYFEKRLVEAVYGVREKEMLEVLGKQDWMDDAHDLGDTSMDAALKVDYINRDPDNIGSDVIYEKGYSFLKLLEQNFGREQFDAFLKDYFNTYAFQSMTTEKFMGILKEKLFKNDDALWQKLGVEEWVYQPGIPANTPVYSASAFNAIDSTLQTWKASGYNNSALWQDKKYSTYESLYVISHLPDDISNLNMSSLDSVLHFTSSGNAEIQCAWYTLAIKKNYKTPFPAIEKFLMSVGRMKFLKPIYKALMATPEGKVIAKNIFEHAKDGYHPIAVKTVGEIISQ